MNEKLVAGIVTAAAIAPICALCVLGPTVAGSMLAGAFAWLGGAGPLLTTALMIAAGLLVYRTLRRRRTSNVNFSEDRHTRLRPTADSGKHATAGVVPGWRSKPRSETS